MSARPTVRSSRSAIVWIEAEMAMNRPSRVRNTLRGLVVLLRLPVRSGSLPVWRSVSACGPRIETIGSSSGRSITWPLPPRSTSRRAIITA